MTEIYLIRHAQAEGNTYRIMQGHWDGGVTAHGRLQIRALAERLKEIPFDAVYASDLYRARLTAAAVAETHALPLHTVEDLREINVGPWETCFFGNVFHDYPLEADKFVHDQEHFYFPGAETYSQVTDRAWAALELIVRRHPGGRVAVVSHGITIRCLLSRALELPLNELGRHIPIGRNTGVTILRWEDGHVEAPLINNADHLAALHEPEWSRNADLRHESFDPGREQLWYCSCYEDAWRASHGTLKGFDPEVYLRAARDHYRADPGAVLRILKEDEPVGLVDLDTRRGAFRGFGWVSLLYLLPDYRGQGYGIQVLARAVDRYRRLGRRAIRLHVAEENAPAIAFYRGAGFRELAREDGSLGKLLLMEKKLGGPEDA